VTGDEIEIRYVLPTSPQSEHVRFCVRRGKARIFSGCNSRPATRSLQPVALGAAVEVYSARLKLAQVVVACT
jgi:hypothetical protein